MKTYLSTIALFWSVNALISLSAFAQSAPSRKLKLMREPEIAAHLREITQLAPQGISQAMGKYRSLLPVKGEVTEYRSSLPAFMSISALICKSWIERDLRRPENARMVVVGKDPVKPSTELAPNDLDRFVSKLISLAWGREPTASERLQLSSYVKAISEENMPQYGAMKEGCTLVLSSPETWAKE